MKKRILVALVVVLALAATASVVWADKPVQFDDKGNEVGWASTDPTCTRIKDGTLTYLPGRYLAGEPVQPGYDIFGYNYQAHMFNGYYTNVYLNGDGLPPYEGDDGAYYQRLIGEGFALDLEAAEALMSTKWHWPYRDIDLVMKWNDEWLANTDCNDDGELDRHWGYDSYIGSGAWLTNHQSGQVDGMTWTFFTKIVAKTTPDTDCEAMGGYEIWGAFCVIQEVNGGYPPLNEPYGGNGAVLLVTPAGFGAYPPQ